MTSSELAVVGIVVVLRVVGGREGVWGENKEFGMHILRFAMNVCFCGQCLN